MEESAKEFLDKFLGLDVSNSWGLSRDEILEWKQNHVTKHILDHIATEVLDTYMRIPKCDFEKSFHFNRGTISGLIRLMEHIDELGNKTTQEGEQWT